MAAGTLSASVVLSTEIKRRILGARCWRITQAGEIPDTIQSREKSKGGGMDGRGYETTGTLRAVNANWNDDAGT